MKRNYKAVFVAFLFVVFFYSGEGWTVDWVLFSYSPMGSSAYYDKENIKWISKDVVQVWTKISYSEKDIQDWTKKWGPTYKKLSYTIALKEYNCGEKRGHTLSAIYYEQNEVPIVNYVEPTSWISVVPGTMDETLFNIVCTSREDNKEKNEKPPSPVP